MSSDFVNDPHVPLLQNRVFLVQDGRILLHLAGELLSDYQADKEGKPVGQCTISNTGLVLQRRVMRKHAQVFFFSYGPFIMGDSHSFVASFKIRPRVTL